MKVKGAAVTKTPGVSNYWTLQSSNGTKRQGAGDGEAREKKWAGEAGF